MCVLSTRTERRDSAVCRPGDDGGGAGLPAAPAHGLSHGAAPADAGVLDEGAEPEAQVLPHRQHPGQTAPQRRQPQGGDQHLLRVSDLTQPGAPQELRKSPLLEFKPDGRGGVSSRRGNHTWIVLSDT